MLRWLAGWLAGCTGWKGPLQQLVVLAGARVGAWGEWWHMHAAMPVSTLDGQVYGVAHSARVQVVSWSGLGEWGELAGTVGGGGQRQPIVGCICADLVVPRPAYATGCCESIVALVL